MNTLRLLLLTSLAASTSACTSPGGATAGADDPAFLSPRANRASLTVARARSLADDGCAYLVTIDSSVAGRLAPQGWVTMYPPAGTYLVGVRAEGAACPPAVQARTRLDADGSQRLEVGRSPTGALGWSEASRSP